MAKKTYYGVVHGGKLVQHITTMGKMPMLFFSKASAEKCAAWRSKYLKKPNTTKVITF